MEDYRNRYFYHYLIFFIVMAIVLVFVYLQSFSLFYNENRTFPLSNFYHNGKADNLQYRLLKEEQALRFETVIKENNFFRLNGNGFKLIIYRLAASWYRVYFNGVLIGSVGDKASSSNIWNALETFDIGEELIVEENDLVLEVGGKGALGLMASPVLITDNYWANQIMNWYRLSNANVYSAAMGLMFFIFTLLMFLYNSSGNIKEEYLFYALATVIMGLTCFSGTVFYHLYIPALIFSKFVLLAYYLATFFISLAIYKQFGENINRIMGYIILFVLIFLGVFYNRNLAVFYNISNWTNFLVAITVLSWGYTGIKHFKETVYARVLFLASLFLFLACSMELYSIMSGNYYMLNFSLFGTIYFAVGVMLLVVIDFINLQSRIEFEKNKAKLLYEKSIRDGMTGVFNHQYIAATLEKIHTSYALMILDLDNFKDINDTYGHQTGDQVLKQIVKVINNRIRKTDIMGRYGGDEFVIILFNCDVTVVKEIVDDIKSSIEEPIYTDRGEVIYVTSSIGVYVTEQKEEGENVLYKADQALYDAKNSGKNRIVYYREKDRGIN